MRALAAAWPPKARCSRASTDKPSEPAYTEVARPAGPAPTTTTSHSLSSISGSRPIQKPTSALLGFFFTTPSGHTTSGQSSGPGW